MAVRSAARGRGLGRTLLGLAEDMARDAGLPATSLVVLRHNTGARRLYGRLGYVEVGRDRIHLGGLAPQPGGAAVDAQGPVNRRLQMIPTHRRPVRRAQPISIAVCSSSTTSPSATWSAVTLPPTGAS